MVKLTLTQKQIDDASTVLGIIAGFAGVLTANHVFDPQVGALISQTSNLVIAILVGKIGADTASKLKA